MEKQVKMLILVFITYTVAEVKEEMEVMKEMMKEVQERLSISEEKLAKTEDDLAAAISDLALTKNSLATALDDLATKDDLMTTMNILLAKDDKLEKDMGILRAPPFIHACGSHYDSLSISSQTIPYSSLLYSSSNLVEGGLDLSTGVFTSPWPGSYTLTWALTARMDREHQVVELYLSKNGEMVEESKYLSKYSGPDGEVLDQGKDWFHFTLWVGFIFRTILMF